MGNKIRVFLAVVIIAATAVWAVNQVRTRTYSGAQIAFKVGSGSVVVTNRGSDAIPVEMRSPGRTALFRVESADIGLKESSKRRSGGRDAFHAVSFELPPGQAKIDVVRGANVMFVSGSRQRIDAVVTPMSRESMRTTLIFASFVILGALFYISHTLQHRWLHALRKRLADRNRQSKSLST